MEPVSVEELLRWTGGRLAAGRRAGKIASFATDSRTLAPGDFFIPLKGANFDGHRFIAQARAAGAAGTLCENGLPETAAPGRESPFTVIAVGDTGQALLDIAAGYRRRFCLPVAALTGSAGKTTTKDLAAWIMAGCRRVLSNPGNFNNQVGVPLSVLAMDKGHRAAIFELGMNRPGEIGRLADVVKPGCALITNTGSAHVGLLGSRRNIAAAKAEILPRVRNGTALLPADDHYFRYFASFPAGKTVTFGVKKRGEYHPQAIEHRAGGTRMLIARAAERPLEITVPLTGLFNVANTIAAVALCRTLGAPDETIRQRAAAFPAPAHRFQRLRTPAGAHVIDDTYNANPASFRAALAEVRRLAPAGSRLVAVCGSMGELGRFSRRSHRALGRFIARLAPDSLIVTGPEGTEIGHGAAAGGFPEGLIFRAPDNRAAAAALKRRLRPGDWALVKGSRFLGMEEIITRLGAGRTGGDAR